ncbi:MAG: cupin domain-containing protein [Gammaproteobacteria bacterium]
MRTLFAVLILALSPVVALGADAPMLPPEGFALWNSAHLKEVGDRLEKELGTKEIVFETLGTYKGHSVYLVLRGRTARPEYHETESDLQIGLRGKGTFVIGGELVNAEKLPRKQQRGDGIKGGARIPLGPGDIIHVPVGVPHVMEIAPNESYMYILIKLDEEPRLPAK